MKDLSEYTKTHQFSAFRKCGKAAFLKLAPALSRLIFATRFLTVSQRMGVSRL